VLGATLTLASSASATVTIGSNLARAPDVGNPNPGETWTLIGLSSGGRASGGLISPVNGTVTTWRIRAGTSSDDTTFRVIRPVGGGLFTGAGTSLHLRPTTNAISTFPTQIPISIGDYIGIDCCASPDGVYFIEGTGMTLSWFPALSNAAPGRPPTMTNSREVAINADIEPTSIFEVDRIKKLKKARLAVTVDLPNPGILLVGDVRDQGVSATAAAKKKPVLVKRSTITAGAPGQITLIVQGTKVARKKLQQKFRETGKKGAKIEAKLKLSFTPTFGSTTGNFTKTALRR
jgi:hypothetical protein